MPDTRMTTSDKTEELSRLWIPREIERTVSRPKPCPQKPHSLEIQVDWNPKSKPVTKRSSTSARRSVKGMCVCLHVQHMQPRAEKSYLKCQIWIDRGHSAWQRASQEDLVRYAHSLCDFEN